MTAAASFLLGVGIGWSAARYRIAKRETQADELTFLLSPVVQHSVEDAARQSGC
jgi:hypothetical protein